MILQISDNAVPERPRYVKFNDALSYGNFTRYKLYDLIAQGKVVAVKSDRLTLIDLDSVDAYYAGLPRVALRSAPRKSKK